nr:FHA domain-containing protein [Mycetocola reblochoni]
MTDQNETGPKTGVFSRLASGDEASNGTQTGATARFGADFSQALAAASEISAEERDLISSLPSGSALLVVRRGPNAGARFLLDRDLSSVGRHPDADIFLDDVTVSRRHAEFRREGTGFVIHDLGSLNGTYFNGTRIDAAVALHDGAEVQIGKFRLTFYPSRLDVASAGA